MRNIEIKKWKELNAEGEKVESNTMKALGYCIGVSINTDKLAGWDKVRLVNSIERAFLKAEKGKKLTLGEGEYAFIKKAVEKYAHPGWGAIEGVTEALEIFMEAKIEG